LERTLAVTGNPDVSLKDGVAETVEWLCAEYPNVYGNSSSCGVSG